MVVIARGGAAGLESAAIGDELMMAARNLRGRIGTRHGRARMMALADTAEAHAMDAATGWESASLRFIARLFRR